MSAASGNKFSRTPDNIIMYSVFSYQSVYRNTHQLFFNKVCVFRLLFSEATKSDLAH